MNDEEAAAYKACPVTITFETATTLVNALAFFMRHVEWGPEIPADELEAWETMGGRASVALEQALQQATASAETQTADRLPQIEPDARDLIDAVRNYVGKAMREVMRMRMQGDEVATNAYAAAVLEEMPRRIGPLAAAHDALGKVLNDACPDAAPIISLATESPA